MKYRIKERPTGYVSLDGGVLREWPPVGEVIDLPTDSAKGMVAAGMLEPAAKPELAKVETPAPETAKVEKRPAPKRGETRKG